MRKILKIAGKVIKGVGSGIVDTCLPNVKNTIRMAQGDLPEDKPKIEIDFIRLITSITIWIILLLVFAGKVKFSDVVDILTKLLGIGEVAEPKV